MDLIKQLTGKNKQDYEQAAAHIIDNADVKTFEDLVSKEDFLFDFIKQNVAKRLQQACNENNYKNLLNFLIFIRHLMTHSLLKHLQNMVIMK